MNIWDILTIGIIVTHIGVVTVLGIVLHRRAEGLWRYGGLLLAGWLALALALVGLAPQTLSDFTRFPPPLAIGITLPVTVGLVLLLTSSQFRNTLRRLPLSLLVGIQVYRVFGGAFLIAGLRGEMTLLLAIPTGLLDVSIGVSALLVARLLQRRQGHRAARIWNVIGLLDFAYSVTFTLLAAPGLFQVLRLNPGVELMGTTPFLFIALWAVPLSILLHAFTLFALSPRSQASTTQFTPVSISATRS